MNQEKARKMFGIINENEKIFFARIPRCVILDKSMPLAAKNIYYYLIARCCDGPFAWVSQQKIAEDMGMSREWISKNIRKLELLKLIAIKKTAENRNVYMICDVTTLYGDYATMPWDKNIQPVCEQSFTPPVNEASHPLLTNVHTPCERMFTPPVNECSHKEEEEKKPNSRRRMNEEEISIPPTPSGEGIVISKPTKQKKSKQPCHPEDLEIALKWLKLAEKEMPWQKKWTQEGFAEGLAKIRKATDLNHLGLNELFNFVEADDFWRNKALSPLGLLKQSANGNRKIDNLILSMKGGVKYKSAREFEKSSRACENWDPSKSPF